jgi:uncharacterized membrane protein YedE/YeeE
MGGAVCVTLLAFAWTQRLTSSPYLEPQFQEPARTQIDMPLLGGSALFGVGWGLAGYCPGPALASALLNNDALIFTVAMLTGMLIMKTLMSRNTKTSS